MTPNHCHSYLFKFSLSSFLDYFAVEWKTLANLHTGHCLWGFSWVWAFVRFEIVLKKNNFFLLKFRIAGRKCHLLCFCLLFAGNFLFLFIFIWSVFYTIMYLWRFLFIIFKCSLDLLYTAFLVLLIFCSNVMFVYFGQQDDMGSVMFINLEQNIWYLIWKRKAAHSF